MGNKEGEVSKKDSCTLLGSLYIPVDIILATVQTLEGMCVFMGPQQLGGIFLKSLTTLSMSQLYIPSKRHLRKEKKRGEQSEMLKM